MEANVIQYREIFGADGSCVNRVILCGCGGAGKTTMLKMLSKDVIEGKFESSKHIKFVLYIELKELESIQVDEPVFVLLKAARCQVPDENAKLAIKRWIYDNSSKLLINIDGYDQLSNPLSKDDEFTTDSRGFATARQVLYGLLDWESGFLADATVFLTTREYSLQHIPPDMIPDRVLKLIGLSNDDIDKLVIEMSNRKVLQSIKNADLAIYAMCSSPLFCTIVVWAHFTRKQPPETKSGILMCLVLNFLTSVQHLRGTTANNLYKLSELALYGTTSSKVIFSDAEIRQHDLTENDLKDMVISIPDTGQWIASKSYLMAGNYRRYFIHQSIQEILSAIRIVLMEPQSFDDFFVNLQQDSFTEVRLLLFGILFRDENKAILREISEVVSKTNTRTSCESRTPEGNFGVLHDLSRHREISLEHLKTRLINGKVEDLSTLRVLYEVGDGGIIHKYVDDIFLKMENNFDAYAIGKILKATQKLSRLSLGLTNYELLQVLLKSCDQKIPEIEWLGYGGLRAVFGPKLSMLANKSKKLWFSSRELESHELESFVQEINEQKRFTDVKFQFTRITGENIDALVKLMEKVDGAMVFDSGTNPIADKPWISNEVRDKIPKKHMNCHVSYFKF